MPPERWRQIEALYNAARERGPDALADTPDDLRREVESLLAQESGVTHILNQPLIQADETQTADAGPIRIGMNLGPYRIDAPIGQGGMGVVFRATDTRLNRTVAIKTALTPFDPRFQREARAIATLNHPNICTLYDIGPDYLVMELCEGETLAARIGRGRLPRDETLKIGSQIAAALAAAHGKGIVHRDLKPANVIVGPNGVKVLDFGLAKSDADDTLTATHAVMGTPAYMAPEQYLGEAADSRADLFALGLILFEMATGQRPFPGASAGRVVAEGSAPAPVVPAQLKLPRSFATLIGNLLKPSPAARCQTVGEVQTALAAIAGEMSSGFSPRLALAAGLATVLAVGAIAYIYSGRDSSPSGDHSLAILQFQNKTGDPNQAALAGGLTSAIRSDLGTIPSLRLVTAPRDTGGDPPATIARGLNVEGIIEGSLDRSGSEIAFTATLIAASTGLPTWTQQFHGVAGGLAQLQAEASRSIAAAIRVPVAKPAEQQRPVNAEAYDLFLRGRFHSGRDNEAEIDQAIGLFERSAAIEPNFAPTQAELARAYGEKSSVYHPNDPQWEEKGFAALQRALAIDPNSPESHYARGFMLWRPSHAFPNREALAEHQAAIAARPNFDEAWHQRGLILFHIGHLKAAQAAIDRALSINPNNLQARFRYGPILVYRQKYEEAIDALNKVPRAVYPPQWTYQMAWSLLTLGRRAEAEKLLNDTLKESPADQGGVLHAARAMLRALEGNRAAAESDISEAIRLGKNFGHFHHTAYTIGAIYSVLGEYDKTQVWIERAANDGFPNYTMFETDPHLKGARTAPAFKAYLAKLRADWENVGGDIE